MIIHKIFAGTRFLGKFSRESGHSAKVFFDEKQRSRGGNFREKP